MEEIKNMINKIIVNYPQLKIKTTEERKKIIIELIGEIDDMEYFLFDIDENMKEGYIFNEEMFITPFEHMEIIINEV